MIRLALTILLLSVPALAQNPSWDAWREKREAAQRIERMQQRIGENEKAIAELEFQAKIGRWLFAAAGGLIVAAIGKWATSKMKV